MAAETNHLRRVPRPPILLALVLERLPLLELGLLALGVTGAAGAAWVGVFGPIGRSSGDYTAEWINDLMTWAPSTAVFISVVSDNMFPRQGWPPFISLVAGIVLWIPHWMAPHGAQHRWRSSVDRGDVPGVFRGLLTDSPVAGAASAVGDR